MTEVQLKEITKSHWATYRKSLDELVQLTSLIATRRREEASAEELAELSSLLEPAREVRNENREVWISTLNTLRLHGYMPADFLGAE